METNRPRDVLRFVTAGSVDDGKSTLIGRLLHDCGGVHEDTLESLAGAGPNGLDFAFITDGLKAEREQGITIDVAYRHFRTARRSFIIADCPGHLEYTRNMVTGASMADLAVLLIDASKGVLEQTRRHTMVLVLMGVPRVLAVVNKMDLVSFDAEVFRRIEREFTDVARQAGIPSAEAMPVSAALGENVAARSLRMPWYQGPCVLEFLENAGLSRDATEAPFRFPVQWVIRGAGGFRGYAGTLVSGAARPGLAVTVLPSGRRTRILTIHSFAGEREIAVAPEAVTVRLEDDVECGRGSLLAEAERPPEMETRMECDLVWMGDRPLEPRHPYLLKHTSQTLCAEVTRIAWRMDFQTLQTVPAGELRLNDIGRVALEVHRPIALDKYSENRSMGSFILIDPGTNDTVAAGMVCTIGESQSGQDKVKQPGKGLVLWLTGLSAAGKTTISNVLQERLWAMGHRVEHLDGDVVRQHLSKGLGFSREDRDENIRRIGFVARMLAHHGVIVLVSAISPYRETRDEVRAHLGGRFVEVYVNAPLAVCEQRDVKGLYKKARAGLIEGFTGIDDPYEPPVRPELECHTDLESIGESAQKILDYLKPLLD